MFFVCCYLFRNLICSTPLSIHPDQIRGKQVFIATLTALFAVVLVNPFYGLIALLCVTALTWLIARLVLRLLPGLTGDIYGAINEISEVMVVLIFTAWLL